MNTSARKPPEDFRQPVIGVGTLNISDRAKELVLQTLNHNRLSYGPMTEKFESEFAKLHSCRFGIMSNSGTSALQVALQTLKELHGWNNGDEVLVPALTFVATANIVLHNGMIPVLVDVDPVFYGMDPALIEARITPRTRAIIPAHLFGHPADMDPIREIADQHGLKIIEDSCETMFASYNGKRVGSLGDIGCFSTYVAHLLVTGVGGLNTANNPDYAVRMRSLINHGRDSIYISIDDDAEASAEELRMIIGRRFKFTTLGHSFRTTEMEAALGLAQLEDWETVIAARRVNAQSLIRKLAHLESHLQLPKIRTGSEHSFMMFPIVLREESKEGISSFLEENGVETREMLPLTNQPVYHKLLNWRQEDYPVSHRINKSGFYVGCHQDLTEADLDHVGELFERYFRRKPTQTFGKACLIISTHNNKPTLEQIVRDIPRDLFETIAVVDDHSTDGTLELLKQAGIPAIPLQGKDSMHMVIRGHVARDAEALVFFPADGSYKASDIGRLLLTLERGNDMVIASRFLPGGTRYEPHRRMRFRSTGNRIYTFLANLLFYGNLTDTLSVFRAVRHRRLIEARIKETGLQQYYLLSIMAMKRRWKVSEIPTKETVKPGTYNLPKILFSGFRLTYTLLKELFSRRDPAFGGKTRRMK